MTEFEQAGTDAMMARWRHPDSDVVINDEDMPIRQLVTLLERRSR